MKRFQAFFFALFSAIALHGQDADTASISLSDSVTFASNEDTSANQDYKPTLIEPDSLRNIRQYRAEKIVVRRFDQARWKEIVGDRNYNEKQTPRVERKAFTPSPWAGAIIKIFSYLVIIVLVIVLIYFVIKNIELVKKVKKKTVPMDALTAQVEHIDDFDWQELLQKAILEGNLRSAVRIYYLGLLRKLNEIGMIVWKKDKTNRDYLSELMRHEGYFEEIFKLTLAYEQIWYGDHPVSQDYFQKLTRHFESVDQRINSYQP